MSKTIGFFGLGIMGSRIAMNIVRAGYNTSVYNRSKSKTKELEDVGAMACNSVAELAASSGIFMTMLSDPVVVEEYALGEEGFLKNLKPGSTWIDFSTVNPAFTRQMLAESLKRGIRFVDAPVSGTKLPAEKGELIIMVGGKETDLMDLVPVFNVVGKKTIYFGEVGKGTSMKMVVNLLLANAMASFAEGLNLGRVLGLDLETIRGVLSGGPVLAPFLATKYDKISGSDDSTDFPLKHMHKDLFLATQEAYFHEIALPQTSATRELYGLAVKEGFGEMDFSAICKFLESKK